MSNKLYPVFPFAIMEFSIENDQHILMTDDPTQALKAAIDNNHHELTMMKPTKLSLMEAQIYKPARGMSEQQALNITSNFYRLPLHCFSARDYGDGLEIYVTGWFVELARSTLPKPKYRQWKKKVVAEAPEPVAQPSPPPTPTSKPDPDFVVRF